MQRNIYIPLESRSIISLSGSDIRSFLQGLVTRNIDDLTEDNSIYGLFLTPQGKFLYDFFAVEMDDKIFMDIAHSSKNELITSLKRYKLRADVDISDQDEIYQSVALLGDKVADKIDGDIGSCRKFCKGISYLDSRSQEMFARSIIERENEYQSFISHDFALADIDEYQELRINNKIADDTDMQSGKSFPLQYNMDSVNAIDFDKGCYVGQEVTTRSKHRGNAKKSIYLIEKDSNFTGSADILSNDKIVGTVASHHKNKALALLNNDQVQKNLDNCILRVEDKIIQIVK